MILERVENGLEAGWPDVYYCWGGAAGWIELKAPSEPARPTTRLMSGQHELTREQRNWHLAHWLAKGRSWILIGSEHYIFLVHSSGADKVNRLNTTELAKASEVWAQAPFTQKIWNNVFMAMIK